MKKKAETRRESALIEAVLSGSLPKVEELLQAGENLSQTDPMGRTALHHAVINGREDLVDQLLRARADPNHADHRGWTPLHFAAQSHAVEIAQALIGHDAVIDMPDEHGNTPLFRAVFESRGRGEMITLLRAHGADELRKNAHGVSPLDLAGTIANFDVKRWFD